jgi:hypothetical protein
MVTCRRKTTIKPFQDPGSEEHQRILLEIRPEPRDKADLALEGWLRVYAGFSEEEIAEVEALALARDHFLRSAS